MVSSSSRSSHASGIIQYTVHWLAILALLSLHGLLLEGTIGPPYALTLAQYYAVHLFTSTWEVSDRGLEWRADVVEA